MSRAAATRVRRDDPFSRRIESRSFSVRVARLADLLLVRLA
jgi:hypothetical protein